MSTILHSAQIFLQNTGEGVVDEAGTDTAVGATFTVGATIWMAVTSVVIPLLTGLLTRLDAHPLVKNAVTAVLSVLSAVVAAAVLMPDGSAVVSWNTVVLAIVNFAGSLLTYVAYWRFGAKDPSTGARVSINTKLAPRTGLLIKAA